MNLSGTASPLECFFTCRACGLNGVCRACAYTCHLGHCVSLVVNYGNLTCECGTPEPNRKTGDPCMCLPEEALDQSDTDDEEEEEEIRLLEQEVGRLRLEKKG